MDWRHWTVLQVVAIVVSYRGKVLSERAQGCVYSQLSLRCPETKVIQITGVVLGDSSCSGSSCCIKDSDCTRDANANHKADVNSRCNNRQSCAVGVLREKITCGIWNAWSNNDFERITYNCIDDPQRSTTAAILRLQSTRITFRSEENTSRKQTEKGSTTETFSTSSRSASPEGAEETPPKMEIENGSTPATFSQSDSADNRLRTEEITPTKETENDDTTTSADLQTKEISEQNVNEHDENGTSEDRSDNSWLTTPIFSRPDSTGNIVQTEVNTPENKREHGLTTATSSTSDSMKDILLKEEKPPEKKIKTVEIASSADIDKNRKGFYDNLIGNDENGSPEDNPWIIPVVMTTVCLLVVIAIVVLVAMMRRNKRLKGIDAAEMTYLGSFRSDAINENDNQTMSLNNNGSGSQINSNDDNIKESNNTDPKASEDFYKVPNNAVNSVVSDAGSIPTEDPIALDSREPAYQTPGPRSDTYSVARDIGEPDCSGSTADASNEGCNVHSDVDNREPDKEANSSEDTSTSSCLLIPKI